MKKNREISTLRLALPIIGLFLLIVFGVIVMPQILSTTKEVVDVYGNLQVVKEVGPSMPLELIFIFASVISVINLFSLGFNWDEIQDSVVKKVTQLIPAAMILFSIGLLVGSWIFSGTIPMLIYYGVDLINPKYMYLVALIVPSIFSVLTGTSWGSAGTIGVVIMGIATAIDSNLVIVAGAIVAGSYFGDKISPLSDTTNIAALAADVPLMDHIRSMLNTTGPAYILALIAYGILGYNLQTDNVQSQLSDVVELKEGLYSLFNFSNAFQIILILIPIVIVLYGSFARKPTVPTLLASATVAGIVGLVIHNFTFNDAFTALNSGFDTSVIFGEIAINDNIQEVLNRGGLYSMVGPVIISIMAFIFVGTLDLVNTIPHLVNKGLHWMRTKSQVIISSLFATGITNALTSNQFATSYIIAEAFGPKYDEFKISRKVLSRSIEDYGTMIESLLPWTTTGVFMYGALGISPVEYWKFQYVSLFGFIVAIVLAITGIGCFYNEVEEIKKGE